MSSTRGLTVVFGFPAWSSEKPTLQKVSPTKSLLIRPMLCEQQAAQIRNRTIDSIVAGNTADIAYRFLQARRGENNTFYKVIVIALAVILLSKFVFKDPGSRLVMLAWLLNLPPNISNTLRYKVTKQLCEEWLTRKLGSDKVKKIRDLRFNKAGMFQLKTILNDEKIDVTSLANRNKDGFSYFPCFNMDK